MTRENRFSIDKVKYLLDVVPGAINNRLRNDRVNGRWSGLVQSRDVFNLIRCVYDDDSNILLLYHFNMCFPNV